MKSEHVKANVCTYTALIPHVSADVNYAPDVFRALGNKGHQSPSLCVLLDRPRCTTWSWWVSRSRWSWPWAGPRHWPPSSDPWTTGQPAGCLHVKDERPSGCWAGRLHGPGRSGQHGVMLQDSWGAADLHCWPHTQRSQFYPDWWAEKWKLGDSLAVIVLEQQEIKVSPPACSCKPLLIQKELSRDVFK